MSCFGTPMHSQDIEDLKASLKEVDEHNLVEESGITQLGIYIFG